MAFYLRPLAMPLSLCEIKSNRNLYDKREVRIKAYLEVLEITKIEDESFDTISSLELGCAGASVVYSEKLKTDETLQQLRKELNEANKRVAQKFF